MLVIVSLPKRLATAFAFTTVFPEPKGYLVNLLTLTICSLYRHFIAHFKASGEIGGAGTEINSISSEFFTASIASITI